MRPGDGHELAPRHRFAERFGTANHRQAEVARPAELGMILRHGRRDDDGPRRAHVRGIVTDQNVHAQSLEVAHARRIGVAPRDPHSAPHEELGERAHPRAGDADEVNGTRVAGIKKRHWGARPI